MKSSLFYFPDADLYINTGRPPAKFAACCFMILTVASVSLTGCFGNVAAWTNLLRQRRSPFQAFSSPSAALKVRPSCFRPML
jgi:hypothetical protein